MKNKLFVVLGLLFIFLFIAYQSDKAGQSDYENQASEPKQEIHCMVCSKDLTNDYNRISPNANGNYYCTPCYKKTMREVHRNIQAEGYD